MSIPKTLESKQGSQRIYMGLSTITLSTWEKKMHEKINCITAPTLDFHLVTTKEAFLNLFDEHGYDYDGHAVDTPCDGFVLGLWHKGNEAECVVYIKEEFILKSPMSHVVNTIAHESSHLADRLFKYMGEHEPSKEFRAYTIGNISEAIFERLAVRYKQYFSDALELRIFEDKESEQEDKQEKHADEENKSFFDGCDGILG